MRQTTMVLPGSTRAVATDNSSTRCLDRDDKYEIKSGKLLLMHRIGQKTVWLPVYVRVYRNAFEHFAVISKDQVVSGKSTYVNLRSASCCGVVPSGEASPSSPSSSSSSSTTSSSSSSTRSKSSLHDHPHHHTNRTRFTVVQNNFEGTVISFACDEGEKGEEGDSVGEWLNAFSNVTPPPSPTQGGMSPTISPVIPRSPVMPTLTELEEEE